MSVILQRASAGKYVRVRAIESAATLAPGALDPELVSDSGGPLDFPAELDHDEHKDGRELGGQTAGEAEMHNMIFREYLWFSGDDISALNRQKCWFLAHKVPSDQFERYVASGFKLFFERYSLYLERFAQYPFRQRLVAIPRAGYGDCVDDDVGSEPASVRQGSLRRLQSVQGQRSYIATGTRMVLFVLRLLDHIPDLVSESVLDVAARAFMADLKARLNAQSAEPSDEWVIGMLDSVVSGVIYPVLYGLAREEVPNPALQIPLMLSVLRALSVTTRDPAQVHVRIQSVSALRFLQAKALQNVTAAILYCCRLSYVFAALPVGSQGDDFARQVPSRQLQIVNRGAASPVDQRATLRAGDPLPGSFLAFQELKRFSGLCKKVAARLTQQVKVLRVPGSPHAYQVGERMVDLDGLRVAVLRLDSKLRRAYVDFGEYLVGMSSALDMNEKRRFMIKDASERLVRFVSLCAMESTSGAEELAKLSDGWRADDVFGVHFKDGSAWHDGAELRVSLSDAISRIYRRSLKHGRGRDCSSRVVQYFADIRDLTCALHFRLMGGVPRMPEFASLRVRSLGSNVVGRSVYAVYGGLCFVHQSMKSRHLSGLDRRTDMFLDPQTSLLVGLFARIMSPAFHQVMHWIKAGVGSSTLLENQAAGLCELGRLSRLECF